MLNLDFDDPPPGPYYLFFITIIHRITEKLTTCLNSLRNACCRNDYSLGIRCLNIFIALTCIGKDTKS